MSFIQDILSIFKKRNLPFLERYQEADDVYTFVFEKGQDLSWKAGQHGLFTITHKKIKNGIRPFSVASAPSENVLKITTRISGKPSDFKKAMLELKPGMTVKMSGPVGGFYLKENSPTLLIAGGIGITPFRSIVKQIEADGSGAGRQMHLLYMDSDQSYLYKEELDELAATISMGISYVDSRDKLHEEIEQFASKYKEGQYFIAGPKAMVNSVSAYLQTNGVPKRRIKKDAFFGY